MQPDEKRGGVKERETAQHLYDQAKYVLDDRRQYADSLKASRNTFGAILLAVVGFGLFRIVLFGSPEDELLVHGWGLWTLRVLAVLIAVCLGVGAFYLYTERPVFGNPESDADDDATELQKDPSSGAALASLDLSDEARKTLENASPAQVLRTQARMYSIAYERITRANRRVRRRIERGKGLVLLGLFFLLAAFVAYTLSIRGIRSNAREDQNGHEYPAAETVRSATGSDRDAHQESGSNQGR